jgi:tRNA threonylcarbamoyladenosine biosynthesis protein TsaE
MLKEKEIFTEQDTIDFASEFSKQLNGGEVVVLNGNLGAGKTFFIKAVIRNFNVEEGSSPTFALVNEYYGNKKFYHFDFYRIEREEELYDIGIDEYLSDPEAIKFIEWGNLFPGVLPEKRIEVEIILKDDNKREIIIKHF